MSLLISVFDYFFVGSTSYSEIYDIANATEVLLDISVDEYKGAGGGNSLTLTVEHSNDGANWRSLEEITFVDKDTLVKSYTSGFLSKLRLKFVPDPGPWEVDGIQCVVTVSALLRGLPLPVSPDTAE